MLDLFVELRGAGQLLKELADNESIQQRDFVIEMVGDKLLAMASRCEELMAENELGVSANERGIIQQEQHFTA